MFKSYVILAWRNLLRDKLVALIHLAGFSLAIGCSLVAFQFLSIHYSFDSFHTRAERIFMVSHETKGGVLWSDVPIPISAALRDDFSNVEGMTRFIQTDLNIKHEGEILSSSAEFVDGDFFKMFDFPIQQGSSSGFDEGSGVVISQETAIRFFGDKSPIGEVIDIAGEDMKFRVIAVFDEIPINASFKPTLLLPISIVLGDNGYYTESDWHTSVVTFVQLSNPGDTSSIYAQMPSYIRDQNKADPQWAATSFPLIAVDKLALRAEELNGTEISSSSKMERLTIFSITLFLLFLACFNYINIALASGSKRIREIGVRKVLGSSKYQLIAQFTVENIAMTFLAMLISYFWARLLFIPYLINLVGFELLLPLDSWQLWVFALSIVISVGFISALYPSVYISSFRPSGILKGKLKLGKHQITKVFLMIQLTLSTICILGSIAMLNNTAYLKKRDWGYNKEQLIVIPHIYETSKFETMAATVQNLPGVVNSTRSLHHVGVAVGFSMITRDNQNYNTYSLGIAENYFDVMGIKLKDGRLIDPLSATDKRHNVVVNEAFLNKFEIFQGYEDFTFQYRDSLTYNIVGVVENFHFYPFYEKISPMFLHVAEDEELNHLIVKARPGNVVSVNQSLETAWKLQYPDDPYRGFYQDDVFNSYLTKVGNQSKIITTIAIMSIILSCMGLFGMMSFSNRARLKEFSIRKVIGAGTQDLLKVINKDIYLIMLINALISLPLGFFLVNSLMDNLYTYYQPLNLIMLIAGFITVLAIVFITLASLINKAIKVNPVEFLGDE